MFIVPSDEPNAIMSPCSSMAITETLQPFRTTLRRYSPLESFQ